MAIFSKYSLFWALNIYFFFEKCLETKVSKNEKKKVNLSLVEILFAKIAMPKNMFM